MTAKQTTTQATNNQQSELIFVGIQICSVLPNKESVMSAISQHTSVDTYLKAVF